MAQEQIQLALKDTSMLFESNFCQLFVSMQKEAIFRWDTAMYPFVAHLQRILINMHMAEHGKENTKVLYNKSLTNNFLHSNILTIILSQQTKSLMYLASREIIS